MLHVGSAQKRLLSGQQPRGVRPRQDVPQDPRPRPLPVPGRAGRPRRPRPPRRQRHGPTRRVRPPQVSVHRGGAHALWRLEQHGSAAPRLSPTPHPASLDLQVHRFKQINSWPKQFDTARFDIPSRTSTATGAYIVYYMWRGYRDCIDVDVLDPVTDPVPATSRAMYGYTGPGLGQVLRARGPLRPREGDVHAQLQVVDDGVRRRQERLRRAARRRRRTRRPGGRAAASGSPSCARATPSRRPAR